MLQKNLGRILLEERNIVILEVRSELEERILEEEMLEDKIIGRILDGRNVRRINHCKNFGRKNIVGRKNLGR